MRDDPIHTFVLFMTGGTPDQMSLGFGLRWFTVLLYWALFAGGLAVAAVNWRRDPAQRTGSNLAVFLLRFTLAGMWYQGTLWKLPLPIADGFKYWMEQSVKFSSFQVHADFMQVMLDHLSVVQPLVYLLEIAFTASLMLGFLVRPVGIVAGLFLANLLIALYNDGTEWPWTYMGLIVSHAMFAASNAGYSLGLDNLLARDLLPRFAGDGRLARTVRLVS